MKENNTNSTHVTGGQQNTTSYVLDTNRTAICVDQACALWSTREIYSRSAVLEVSCPAILDSLLPDFSELTVNTNRQKPFNIQKTVQQMIK